MTESQRIARQQSLGTICKQCMNFWLSQHPEGRTFPYEKCRRCNTGREIHELDSQGWKSLGIDSVKRDW